MMRIYKDVDTFVVISHLGIRIRHKKHGVAITSETIKSKSTIEETYYSH